MKEKFPINPETIKGFLATDEGLALYRYTLEVCARGPCLEVGSYCGKSTIYLGTACQRKDSVLYALDHHRGSEEHQVGEEYYDPDLYDDQIKGIDSFKEFRKTIGQAGLTETVIPIVSSSTVVSKRWVTPLALVFIDGGHSMEAAMADYRSWAGHIMHQGILAIHDLFPDPSQGGQAPYRIWQLALASGLFQSVEIVRTLGFLRRIN